MELRPKPYQNQVSPTKQKVIMHTKSHVIIQPTNQFILSISYSTWQHLILL